MTHKFVCEIEFHSGCDGGVDYELGGGVLGCTACDAIHDAVLARECRDEGGEGGVVDSFVRDVRVRRNSVGRGGAGYGRDSEAIGFGFEKFG